MSAERRVALITGGSRGIGLGISRRLARDGLDLAINGVRSESEVAESVDELRQLDAEVLYLRADIGNRDERTAMLDAIRKRFGRLDVLVNNAGVAPPVRADILEAGEESFEQVIRTNLLGPYFLTQAVAKWMIEQQKAEPDVSRSIVFITSVSATVASINRGDYCMSKAGLSMAAKLWTVRMAEFGIPVYEVRPGIVETDMTAPVREKYDGLIESGLLLESRWGKPEDVGKAVAMLVRGDLPYATGAVLTVDGGFGVERL